MDSKDIRLILKIILEVVSILLERVNGKNGKDNKNDSSGNTEKK